MKVKIIRQTFVKGELAAVGDILDVDEKTFFVLVKETRKAIEFKKTEKMLPPEVENREKDVIANIVKRSHKKKKR